MKIRKVLSVIERGAIKKIAVFNSDMYRKYYVSHLKKNGMIIEGMPNFISHDAYFDGYDYSLIKLGNNVTISKEVMLLTHDGSVHTIKNSLSIKNKEKLDSISGAIIMANEIKIGENTFIGARSSLLPGTTIGKNVLVGACSVVKGNIPDNAIVAGNPAKVIGNTSEWLDKKITAGQF